MMRIDDEDEEQYKITTSLICTLSSFHLPSRQWNEPQHVLFVDSKEPSSSQYALLCHTCMGVATPQGMKVYSIGGCRLLVCSEYVMMIVNGDGGGGGDDGQ